MSEGCSHHRIKEKLRNGSCLSIEIFSLISLSLDSKKLWSLTRNKFYLEAIAKFCLSGQTWCCKRWINSSKMNTMSLSKRIWWACTSLSSQRNRSKRTCLTWQHAKLNLDSAARWETKEPPWSDLSMKIPLSALLTVILRVASPWT